MQPHLEAAEVLASRGQLLTVAVQPLQGRLHILLAHLRPGEEYVITSSAGPGLPNGEPNDGPNALATVTGRVRDTLSIRLQHIGIASQQKALCTPPIHGTQTAHDILHVLDPNLLLQSNV